MSVLSSVVRAPRKNDDTVTAVSLIATLTAAVGLCTRLIMPVPAATPRTSMRPTLPPGDPIVSRATTDVGSERRDAASLVVPSRGVTSKLPTSTRSRLDW